MGLLDDLDHRRESRERDIENSAQFRVARYEFTTDLDGSISGIMRPDVVPFGFIFIEKPSVSYALEIDYDSLSEVLELLGSGLASVDVGDLPVPQATGVVTSWDQDERDHWTGAWVATRVSFDSYLFPSTGEASGYDVFHHHFTFAGVAMKDIPLDNTDAVE